MEVEDWKFRIQKIFPRFPSYVGLSAISSHSTKTVKMDLSCSFLAFFLSRPKPQRRLSMAACAVFVLLPRCPYNKCLRFTAMRGAVLFEKKIMQHVMEWAVPSAENSGKSITSCTWLEKTR